MLGEGTRLQRVLLPAQPCSVLVLQGAKSTQSSAAHLSWAPLLFSRQPPALLQSGSQQQQGKGAHIIYTQKDSSSLQVLGVFSQF